jgi:U4/U6 small nuclear ribonucleoprotein PRP3
MKARQAMLEKEREQAAVNPNMIEVTARAPVPVKEEKPKDPIPDVEWW